LDSTLQAIVSDTESGQSSLIPLLQRVQEELGYVPEDAIYVISERTGVPASEVFGVHGASI